MTIDELIAELQDIKERNREPELPNFDPGTMEVHVESEDGCYDSEIERVEPANGPFLITKELPEFLFTWPATEDLSELAKLIWETSHADEGTISATGAEHIARAILASGEVVTKAVHERAVEQAEQRGRFAQLTDTERRDLAAVYGYQLGREEAEAENKRAVAEARRDALAPRHVPTESSGECSMCFDAWPCDNADPLWLEAEARAAQRTEEGS